MFLGKHVCKLESNNKLKLPKGFIKNRSREFYLIQGFEKNLLCLEKNAFSEVFQKVASLNITDPLARLLLRLIMGSAHNVQMEKDGYFQMPESLFKLIGNGPEVCIVGQGDFFEIWSVESWKKQESLIMDVESNSSRFANLEITLR